MAPSKTPEPIIRKLSELLLKLVDDPEVKEDHAQHWRQYGRDHARAVPRADRAGNCAVEAVDPGDRGVEIAAVDLRACRISAIAGCSNMTSTPTRACAYNGYDHPWVLSKVEL